MLIGAMNHPKADVLEELAWMAEMGLGFVDLTLEPPAASPERVDAAAVRAALDRHGMDVVGHTAHYLPLASALEPVRAGAVQAVREALAVFAEVGVRWVNLHPDRRVPMHGREYLVERNIQSLAELLDTANDLGIGLMVENMPGGFNTLDELAPILDALPQLGLHLDLGHCNLQGSSTRPSSAEPLITTYGSRLQHVHLHDNKGGTADLHLPLGTGTIDYQHECRLLREAGYDGTITLEVFSPDRHYLALSRDLLQQAWNAAASGG